MGGGARNRKLVLVCVVAWGLAQVAAQPQDGPDELQPLFELPRSSAGDDQRSPLDRFRDHFDLRLAIDLSARGIFSDARDEFSAVSALGLDLHKVFRDDEGDWATLVLQPYLTRIDNLPMHPPFFEDDDDWELVWRIANLNFTRLSHGQFNLRVGHFEIPYGLEHVINTNGTLRDFTHGRNLGVKADWGAGINGDLGRWEYEATLSRGTGNEYSSRGRPYAVAARVGTDRDQAVALGVSFFHGRVANPGAAGLWRGGFDLPAAIPDVGAIVRRTRTGVDLQARRGPFDFLVEGSFGRDYHQAVGNAFAEVDWNSPGQRVQIYTQVRAFFQEYDKGWVDDVSVAAGTRFTPNTALALSAQLVQGFSNFRDTRNDTLVFFQARYRF